MKGCTSKCLLLDTEGVIVSPSADLPFNGGLSDGSHAKVCVALLYLDGCSAEWPKCFTPAPNLRAAFTSLLLLGIVKAEAQSPCAKSTAGAISACEHANVKPLCEFISPISCHASITLCRVLAGCSGCALVFQHPISIAQKISFFFSPFHFFAPTARDWHCTEMQNNNPLITWVLPVLGFICSGCESPQCLVITAFDLGNNVFTVALLRAQRQCSFNPQCILVESHYTKTTRVLVWRGGVYMCVRACVCAYGREGGGGVKRWGCHGNKILSPFPPPSYSLLHTDTLARTHTPKCTHCFSWDR